MRQRPTASGGTTAGRIRRRDPSSSVAVRERDAKTPYRYTLPATAIGLVLGWAVGGWVGWDPLFTAIGVGLLASVLVDVLWASRDS